MPATYGEVGESPLNASLRPVVAGIDQEMSRLACGTPLETRTGTGELLESWARLVELLGLGASAPDEGVPGLQTPGNARGHTLRLLLDEAGVARSR